MGRNGTPRMTTNTIYASAAHLFKRKPFKRCDRPRSGARYVYQDRGRGTAKSHADEQAYDQQQRAFGRQLQC